MEAIMENKYIRGNVQMHLAAWPVLPKEEIPEANMLFFTVRVMDSKQRPVEDVSVSYRILDYLFTTEDDRRQVASDVLSLATSDYGDLSTSWPFLEQQLFLFSNAAATVVADYYEATGFNCGGIQVLVDIGPRMVEEYDDECRVVSIDDGCRDYECRVVSIDDGCRDYDDFFLHLGELDRNLRVECL